MSLVIASLAAEILDSNDFFPSFVNILQPYKFTA